MRMQRLYRSCHSWRREFEYSWPTRALYMELMYPGMLILHSCYTPVHVRLHHQRALYIMVNEPASHIYQLAAQHASMIPLADACMYLAVHGRFCYQLIT